MTGILVIWVSWCLIQSVRKHHQFLLLLSLADWTQPTETSREKIILIYVWGIKSSTVHHLVFRALQRGRQMNSRGKCVRNKSREGQIMKRGRQQSEQGDVRRNKPGTRAKWFWFREMFALVPLWWITSRGLLLSRSLLLAAFINRPLCFLSNPQRAQDSLKEKSGTRSHLGGEGWCTLCNGHESRCSMYTLCYKFVLFV